MAGHVSRIPSVASPLHIAVLPDLYRPAILPDPGIRIRLLLRRAKDNLAQIDQRVAKLNSGGDGDDHWNHKHEMFLFAKKWRLEVCLDRLEVFVHPNPETGVKAEVQQLRVDWQCLNRALGYMLSSSKWHSFSTSRTILTRTIAVPCINPGRDA